MNTIEQTGPYPFTRDELDPDSFAVGVAATLVDFAKWRDTNGDLIDVHVAQHSAALDTVLDEHSLTARAERALLPWQQHAFAKKKVAEELGFFCIYNMAELPEQAAIEGLTNSAIGNLLIDDRAFQRNSGVDGFIAAIERHVPVLRSTDELKQLAIGLGRLERILPENVLREGGLVKAAFLIAGELLIGMYDTRHDSVETQANHLQHILPAAYAYAATYPIIDDTLQDSTYISLKDKEQYHKAILEGLRTGHPINEADLPDHPLAEELQRAYNILRGTFDFDDYRHLYQAGEAMYLAQDRDSKRTYEEIARSGVTSLYPDIFTKAAMTRIIANIIAQRNPSNDFYRRAANVSFLNQFRDDLADRRSDAAAERVSLFTAPLEPGGRSPFADLFAYSAYITHEVFANDPRIAKTLINHNAAKVAVYLRNDPEFAASLQRASGVTAEMSRFVLKACGMPAHIVQHRGLKPRDVRILEDARKIFPLRPRLDADPRTFVSDQRSYIEEVIQDCTAQGVPNILEQVTTYALDGGGKRLRPALTLMLAESLGIPYDTTVPILQAVELFHTASLLFDDLPAQDNAHLRRGKPTAHIVYGEASAQLSGIAMISEGFGILSKLKQYYPADRVADVVHYFGSVLGPQRLCLGQTLDLAMTVKGPAVTSDEIIEMYNLKTSTMIEAALVPLMLLTGRPPEELDHLRSFAYHAGIVFQLRDDVLDMTATASTLGKDTNNDVGKINIARQYGMAYVTEQVQEHLKQALRHCQALPFNTDLLQGIVSHFAHRRK